MSSITHQEISVCAELPEALYQTVQQFLKTHPKADFNTIVAKGIESFIKQAEDKTNA